MRELGSWRAAAAFDVVGSRALGPESFMHRASAATNPTTPLSHHMLDSTHITPGVATVRLRRGSGAIGGSWFRGLEPDENRKDIDFGALDSWSLQGPGAMALRTGARPPTHGASREMNH